MSKTIWPNFNLSISLPCNHAFNFEIDFVQIPCTCIEYCEVMLLSADIHDLQPDAHEVTDDSHNTNISLQCTEKVCIYKYQF